MCGEVLEWPYTTGGGGVPPPPPWTLQNKVTIVGKSEIYNRENVVGPFLVHKLLGPIPPLPPSPPSHTSLALPQSGHLDFVVGLTRPKAHPRCQQAVGLQDVHTFVPHAHVEQQTGEPCHSRSAGPTQLHFARRLPWSVGCGVVVHVSVRSHAPTIPPATPRHPQTGCQTGVPDDDDASISLDTWRDFRAKLVQEEKGAQQPSDTEPLASESESSQDRWAHLLGEPEAGCLLVAQPHLFRY